MTKQGLFAIQTGIKRNPNQVSLVLKARLFGYTTIA